MGETKKASATFLITVEHSYAEIFLTHTHATYHWFRVFFLFLSPNEVVLFVKDFLRMGKHVTDEQRIERVEEVILQV